MQRIVWDSWTIQHKFGLPAVSLLPAVQEPITDFTFAQASVNEWFYYTEPILLRDADQYAMANGVEVRAPFMDHRLVSFALSLPDREKSNVRLKELLISSFKDQLPPEVYQRPKKGFTFPWEQWMRGDLRPFCTARITNFADRIGSSYVKQGWNEFLKGNSSISWSRWWTIVAVEDWIERNHLELE
ncbi:MAG: asparagine synthase-related protein [Bacteroidota bacterium]